jgi:UPF0716 protein FxsA
MPLLIKILLLAFPFLEISLLVQFAAIAGFIPVLGSLLLAASLGTGIIRLRGFSALLHMRKSVESGQIPTGEILKDGISAFGGLLLIIPGLLSDVLGLLLQIPMIQVWLGNLIIRQGVASFRTTEYRSTSSIIEGEYTRSADIRNHIDRDPS